MFEGHFSDDQFLKIRNNCIMHKNQLDIGHVEQYIDGDFKDARARYGGAP